MKEMLKVFRFELSQKLKEKSFYITTIIIALVVFLLAASPAIISMFSDKDIDKTQINDSGKLEDFGDGETIPLSKLGIVINGKISDTLITELGKEYELVEYQSQDELIKAVESDAIEEGAVIQNDLEAILYR